MTSPLVSVVLPTYNARSHLEPCLESLKRQTFEDFEIIAVDDGSTDGTIEYLEEHDAVRLFVRTDTDDGLPGALNHGIERANGTYIARQDADDLSYPERFERQIEILESDLAVSLVGTAVDLLEPDGTKRSQRVPPVNPDFEALLEKNRFVHGSVMFRREDVLAVGGYDTGFQYTEDYDLWLRIAAEHRVRNIQAPLYGLRVHDESIYGSQLRTVKLYGWFARNRIQGQTDLTIEDVDRTGIDVIYEDLEPDQRIAFHTEMAQEYLRYGRPTDAREACRSALDYAPLSPLLWVLFGLSYMPPRVTNGVERVYRWIHNRRHSV